MRRSRSRAAGGEGTLARPAPLLALLLLSACAAPPPARGESGAATSAAPQPDGAVPLVRHWGSMRQVLREGATEGRVDLAAVLGAHTVAVGATAGLAAEITVVAGAVHLAEVVEAGSTQAGLRTRTVADGERATLLLAADVPVWSEQRLGEVTDLDALEAAIRDAAQAAGIDVAEPFPFRVEGSASVVQLHVLNRSCPIAVPDGPRPWRYTGEDEETTLVGFHAEGGGGVFTHHGRATHTHALLPARGTSGHLDEVSFATGARLFLPAG